MLFSIEPWPSNCLTPCSPLSHMDMLLCLPPPFFRLMSKAVQIRFMVMGSFLSMLGGHSFVNRRQSLSMSHLTSRQNYSMPPFVLTIHNRRLSHPSALHALHRSLLDRFTLRSMVVSHPGTRRRSLPLQIPLARLLPRLRRRHAAPGDRLPRPPFNVGSHLR